MDVYSEKIRKIERFIEYSKYSEYIVKIKKCEQRVDEIEQEMNDIMNKEKRLWGYNSN